MKLFGRRRTTRRVAAQEGVGLDRSGSTTAPPPVPRPAAAVDIRVPRSLWEVAREHVEDLSRGEQAGFMLCSCSQLPNRDILIAREWVRIPPEAVEARGNGYATRWSAQYNAALLQRCDRDGLSAVLLHSHIRGSCPRLSPADSESAAAMFPAFSRVLPYPSGSVVLGEQAASGRFWKGGEPHGPLGRIIVAGSPIELWLPEPSPVLQRPRLDRQNRAIGRHTDELLRASTVGIVGMSGGGSHVGQQLAHLGVGTLIPIDDQMVDESNTGRVVMARATDVDATYKTELLARYATALDGDMTVIEVRDRVPGPAALEALKRCDVVVACVDTFSARAQINEFCRRHHIPLVDIGINIRTEGGKLLEAAGQVVVVTPDTACIRCTPLLSDAVLRKEAEEKPPGYDRNADAAGDPQVISMNGVLASEAVNSVLDLLTGYTSGGRGAGWWLYDGRRGGLERYDLPPRRPGCPACAQAGHGDSRLALFAD